MHGDITGVPDKQGVWTLAAFHSTRARWLDWSMLEFVVQNSTNLLTHESTPGGVRLDQHSLVGSLLKLEVFTTSRALVYFDTQFFVTQQGFALFDTGVKQITETQCGTHSLSSETCCYPLDNLAISAGLLQWALALSVLSYAEKTASYSYAEKTSGDGWKAVHQMEWFPTSCLPLPSAIPPEVLKELRKDNNGIELLARLERLAEHVPLDIKVITSRAQFVGPQKLSRCHPKTPALGPEAGLHWRDLALPDEYMSQLMTTLHMHHKN